MKKLLHERLRKVKNFGDFYDALEFDVDASFKEEANRVADEIERCYITREDHKRKLKEIEEYIEELELSCKAYNKQINAFIEAQGLTKDWVYADDIKRPQPKVLDADGVEINVGDTVWTVDGKDFGKVIEVNVIHSLLTQEHHAHWFNNDHLTHKEPDSLDSLLNDMFNHTEASGDDTSILNEWVDRLSALIERGA